MKDGWGAVMLGIIPFHQTTTHILATPAFDLGEMLRAMRRQTSRAAVRIQKGQTMQQPVQEKVKILFFAANPKGTSKLALDDEAREIKAKIRASEHRDALEGITAWAVRPADLLQLRAQPRPHVVPFSVHGSKAAELVLLDRNGRSKPVSKEALVDLFRALKGDIRVVFLNACFSRPQAKAIVQEIECAVGMGRAVSDQAAITFAASFYRAVGFGCSVQNAFDQAKVALMLEGI